MDKIIESAIFVHFLYFKLHLTPQNDFESLFFYLNRTFQQQQQRKKTQTKSNRPVNVF